MNHDVVHTQFRNVALSSLKTGLLKWQVRKRFIVRNRTFLESHIYYWLVHENNLALNYT